MTFGHQSSFRAQILGSIVIWSPTGRIREEEVLEGQGAVHLSSIQGLLVILMKKLEMSGHMEAWRIHVKMRINRSLGGNMREG